MSDDFKNFYNGINLRPLPADPTNPKEGDLHVSDGTARAAGIYRFDGASLQKLVEGAAGNLTVTTKTDNYTALISDDVILMNNTTNKTVTLPAASGNTGLTFEIVKIDGTSGISVTIDGNASETIDGALTIDLDRQFQSVRIVSDGSNWFTIHGRHQIDSMIRVHTSNGYGSTNNKIRRFTTTVTNVGSAITFADSATLGSTFTVNEVGIYHIASTDNASGAGFNMGISLNSSQLTTAINAITVADRLHLSTTSGASHCETLSVILILAEGDVIRMHTDGTGTGTADRTHVTMTKIGRI